MSPILLDKPLTWVQVVAVAAQGAELALAPAAEARLDHAHAIVRALVDRDIRAYGINTGVGALSDVLVSREHQSALSHKILLSHAVGIGLPLGVHETRAIMVAAVNNFALGFSGLRRAVVQRIVDLLNQHCTPEVPRQGSVGYLSHMAPVGLLLAGHGHAVLRGERMPAAAALARLGLAPLVLEAKEGLCLVNGTPCATGLACLALERARHVLEWSDAIGAMSFEVLGCQTAAISAAAFALRASPGAAAVAARLRDYLAGSAILAATRGRRTQDALSLRSIPQVHGAVRDAWDDVAVTVDRELRSVTDNPLVTGSPDDPVVLSEAHAMGTGIGLAMDHLATAMAAIGSMAERRLDRMVNPLVSGMPAFLANDSGVASGFMIAQYAAVSLVGENRRLAAPASLDGGITSGFQEDFLTHATPAALKALDVVTNTRAILAIEYLAAGQSHAFMKARPAAATAALHRALRAVVAPYADDRPLGDDMAAAARLIADTAVATILAPAPDL